MSKGRGRVRKGYRPNPRVKKLIWVIPEGGGN